MIQLNVDAAIFPLGHLSFQENQYYLLTIKNKTREVIQPAAIQGRAVYSINTPTSEPVFSANITLYKTGNYIDVQTHKQPTMQTEEYNQLHQLQNHGHFLASICNKDRQNVIINTEAFFKGVLKSYQLNITFHSKKKKSNAWSFTLFWNLGQTFQHLHQRYVPYTKKKQKKQCLVILSILEITSC